MKTKLLNYAAAMLASAAVATSFAQLEEKAPSIDPVASSSRSQGEGADAANAIVQALNADTSLGDSKITVQPEKDSILLTGVAPSQEEVKRASEVAGSSAGGITIVNVIQPRHIVYQMPAHEGVKQ